MIRVLATRPVDILLAGKVDRLSLQAGDEMHLADAALQDSYVQVLIERKDIIILGESPNLTKGK
jgi:hypothetical protein